MDSDREERRRRLGEALYKLEIGYTLLWIFVGAAFLIVFGLYRWLSSVELYKP
ncbi:MAG: hypothetical protein ABI051_13440 [Vicinamibacterales bacterium]